MISGDYLDVLSGRLVLELLNLLELCFYFLLEEALSYDIKLLFIYKKFK